ncbi:MAG: type II toxin-antitoxin system VapC family toxin [Mariniphaga sp.]
MILLDSSVLIDLFRKKEKDKTLFYRLSQAYSGLSISSVSYYEIGIGNRNAHTLHWEALSENLSVIPFDRKCADSAVRIYLELLRVNKMIDLADILIGATAVAHDIPIATLNI